ncbi:hypothetical protein POJ06DRAFT_74201 [Lipomyces tetrasporus]|uniref:Uncharacterized protein n=1 Tax=Lipomyces tetrasporus TaxID=54092 RepID=A0AAD7QUX9_9ASCO|nr:uncharacterized protein POJ06DRAFT_74201 [Lipomyces tetrasporus]KAJ8101944.1 hypothetical protein POJ06DRAFT_74201 [Lipomyces tetrasporus]
MARNPRRLIQEERSGRKLSSDERRLVDDYRLSERQRLRDYRARKLSRPRSATAAATARHYQVAGPDNSVSADTDCFTVPLSTSDTDAASPNDKYDDFSSSLLLSEIDIASYPPDDSCFVDSLAEPDLFNPFSPLFLSDRLKRDPNALGYDFFASAHYRW